ncbi:MAG: hypothetical protein PHS62_00675 [Patescibacteria group bacterium]|nr:hypothetical protein [Patescibacteria group bacterium]
MEGRLENLKNTTLDLTRQMRQEGCPEKAIAAFLSIHEYINNFVKEPRAAQNHLVAPQNRENYARFLTVMSEIIKSLTDFAKFGNTDKVQRFHDKLAGNTDVDEDAIAGQITKEFRKILEETTGETPGNQGEYSVERINRRKIV